MVRFTLSSEVVAEESPIADVERRVAEMIGGLMEFWGFKAVHGRMWTVLYLSPEPLSAAELGDRLALSTGAVSMALADLQKWGVVKKAWRPGERRDYYEPETSIWKMISRVFRERELTYVREAIAAFEAALKTIAQQRSKVSAEDKRLLKFIEGRIQSLLTLSRIGESLLSLLVAGAPIDPKPIKAMFEPEE
jgi:DNA-binding transcriptional regulator GbsR (MarR family)